MTREIFLPIELIGDTAVDFSKKLTRFNFDIEDDVIIYLTNFMKANGRIEPFGTLMAVNAIRNFRSICSTKGIRCKIKYTKETFLRNTYARSLRFFSSLGIDIGESPTADYTGNADSRFIPIMKSPVKSIKDAYDEYSEIKKIARRISIVATNGNQDLYEYVNFCLIEIIRNIVEHSDSRYFWYCAQRWPSPLGGNLVEVAIMDEGIGIQDSLKEELGDEDSKDAIKFALYPGCSSKITTKYLDTADNSGLGLFMMSEISKANGDFLLGSKKNFIKLSSTEQEETNSNINGTIVRIRFDLSKLKEYELEIEEIRNRALELTKRYNVYSEKKKYAPGTPLPNLF
ncbi:ATP-binding protein [Halobacillus yeomjeoni]|uniref:Sensor histidine kinase n=1 Tax=Halobacillus yeomjeoni TaxID=311194 RepID=A0A931HVU3_9BACI|nr:ATP-binding protein [Halobacillus yeomjeoni]MBH0230066.1 sensor histidine kinase [Halobacillus yeomjeoni]